MKKRFLLICLALAVLLVLTACSSTPMDQVADCVRKNLTALDEMDAVYSEALSDCRAYIDGSLARYELIDRLNAASEKIQNIEIEIASDELKQRTLSDKKIREPLNIGELVQIEQENCVNNLAFFQKFLPISVPFKSAQQLNSLVDLYEEYAVLTKEAYWFVTNQTLIQYSGSKDIQNLCSQMSQVPAFAELAGSWSSDADRVTAAADLRYQGLENIVREIARYMGDDTLELNQLQQDVAAQHDEMIRLLMDYYGYDAQAAEKRWEQYKLECELRQAELELEERLQEFRQKFAPTEEDNSAQLFGKAARFASVKLYPEAVACMDAFLSREEDPEAPKICGETARELYLEMENGGINYGLIIILPEENDYLRAGDIFIEIDGAVIYNAESYINIPELREDGYTASILRLNAEGKLETVTVGIPKDKVVGFSGVNVNDSKSFPTE